MKRTLAVVLATAFVSAPLHAQGVLIQFPTPFTPESFSVFRDPRTAIDDMKAALHDLIVAQEKYRNDHGTYTTDGSALGIYPSKSGQPLAQVIFAGSRGWTGMATDRSLKGKSCVVYIGIEKELPGGTPKTMAAGTPAQTEAVPVCDEP
jgi:hypothetical protein